LQLLTGASQDSKQRKIGLFGARARKRSPVNRVSEFRGDRS
jgi:hypothetical protein